jgi:UDP-N-acetylglucosamine 2-epimerase (non-hydrolysing)
MRKVMTIVGTRPELIKMSRVIDELDKHVNHVLVHSGQNYDYELNEVFFKDLEIRKPDYFLEAAGENASKTISNIISKTDDVLERERPDAVLLYGDTNTCLAAIAAKRRQIPIFHMEAGNRCFDQRVPEELNRKIIDHLSDINLVLTEHARRYLILEGIRPETVIKTGSHMQEVLAHFMPKIMASDVLSREELREDQFFVVSMHREENVDLPHRLRNLVDVLNALAEAYGYPIIVSTHPRTRKRLDALPSGLGGGSGLIRFVPAFGLLDYIRLQCSARCVLSDSGTITEECSLLNFPAVMLRDAHERPEGMDCGTLVMSGLDSTAVLDAVKVVTAQHDRSKRTFALVPDYDAGAVSKKIVRIVLSYIDYVNINTWKKQS